MTVTLQLTPNFHQPDHRYHRDFSPGDDFYQLLIDTHRGLSDEQSALLNARLVLLLANHIGNLDTLRDAMRLAREDI